MSTFTKERQGVDPPGGGRKTGMGKGNSTSMKVKPGFSTGLPGKSQPKDRSGGTPKKGFSGMPLDYPQSEGL